MAVSAASLASAMASGIGQGAPTAEVTALATGILDELTNNGSATFGNTPSGHMISGLSGGSMASGVVAAGPYTSVSTELAAMCGAIADHITSNGIVTYTGPPPGNPPPPSESWFLGGTISGLVGPGLASEVQAAVGYPSVSTQLTGLCSAITDHITNNAQVVSGVIS